MSSAAWAKRSGVAKAVRASRDDGAKPKARWRKVTRGCGDVHARAADDEKSRLRRLHRR